VTLLDELIEMKLKVLSYNESSDFHYCKDLETGKIINLDLFTDKEIPGETNRSIIGKEISIERKSPFIEFAYGLDVLK